MCQSLGNPAHCEVGHIVRKAIFLDTNVYLHYQPFDQIKWTDLLDVEEVTIVVPPVVLRQLNNRKDAEHSRRVKRRAGQVLRKLSEMLSSESEVVLGPGVRLRLEDREPMLDYEAYQLSGDTDDDDLIASVIMWREEHPHSDAALVTADLGLLLKAKAGRQSIPTFELPLRFRLPDEPDPIEKEARQLRQRIRELESASPRLSLTFKDGTQLAEFVLPRPVELTEAVLSTKLENLKKQYPPRPSDARLPDKPQARLGGEALAELIAAGANLSLVSEEEIERYNAELDEFYARYERYARASTDHENLKRRAVDIGLLLVNDGTAPAKDIDAVLHLPDGLTVWAEDAFPAPPDFPQPPVPARTPFEMMMRPITAQVPTPLFNDFGRSGPVSPPPNVSPPSIKRTKSYEISYHVDGLKHNVPETLDTLRVAFDSFDEAGSFHIEHHILAGNLPKPVDGRLHIVVKKAMPG
jgi:hypothetical protein